MNFILCPIDFSETADNAAKYALSVAHRTNSKLLYTYIIPMSVTEPLEDYHPLHDRNIPPEQSYPIIRKDLEGKLETFAAAMQDSANDGVQVFYAIKEGEMDDAIKELDQEQKIDLIIMGTQGASGINETFVGSNTAKMIKALEIPVLAVPHQARYKDVKSILYAEDLHDDEWQSLSQLETFAREFDAELKVIHVYGEDEKDGTTSMERFKEKFQQVSKYGKVSFYDVAGENVEEALEKAALDLDCDLIAMQTRKRNFWQGLFNKSLTKKMAYHTHIPLLAMHV